MIAEVWFIAPCQVPLRSRASLLRDDLARIGAASRWVIGPQEVKKPRKTWVFLPIAGLHGHRRKHNTLPVAKTGAEISRRHFLSPTN